MPERDMNRENGSEKQPPYRQKEKQKGRPCIRKAKLPETKRDKNRACEHVLSKEPEEVRLTVRFHVMQALNAGKALEMDAEKGYTGSGQWGNCSRRSGGMTAPTRKMLSQEYRWT